MPERKEKTKNGEIIYYHGTDKRISYVFDCDDVIKYKSKFLIYSNVTLREDHILNKHIIPKIFSYKYLIHLCCRNLYLFLNDDNEPLFQLYPSITAESDDASGIVLFDSDYPPEVKYFQEALDHLNYSPKAKN